MLAGLLIGTSYIPLPPWAIFFCFVPLWLAWMRATSAKQVFFSGWIAQFILTLLGFNWVSYTVHEFGHLPWPFAILVLFGFCSICTLSIPVFGVLWFWYARKFKLGEGASVLALAAFQAVGERVFPMIFDWHFGYTWLWAGFPAFHLADMIGFIGLSNVGLMLNAAFLYAYLLSRRQGRWGPWLAAPVVVFALMNIAGYFHAQNLEQPDASRRFLIVQANIGNEDKLAAEAGPAFRDVVLGRWERLTEIGARETPKADFAVWPETAFPDYMDRADLGTGYPLKLKRFITDQHLKLITGGYSHLAGTARATNSFFVLSDEGRWLDPPYHKTMLLAFGEYFPGANLIPKLRDWFPEVADFGRGPGPSVLNGGDVRLGAQICYEGLFDWFSRGLANKGAQIIVNLTNDSWYGTWEQPFQHLYMTLARAIEVRRPLVRATNTGISGVVLASGQILELSPMHVDWQHTYEVPFVTNPKPTIFMGWGFWLIPFLLGLTLVLLPFKPK